MIYSLILYLDWEKGWKEWEIIKFKEWFWKLFFFLILVDFVF